MDILETQTTLSTQTKTEPHITTNTTNTIFINTNTIFFTINSNYIIPKALCQ